MPSDSQIKAQSLNAIKQWGKQWAEHANAHKHHDMKPLEDFKNTGIGKALLLVANGYSFERDIETIKENKDKIDIMACDKTLGHLIKNGIKPKYCLVCDANVDYERYLAPYKDQLQDTILFQNVCGNPKWTINGNWKDKYFFVNMDCLNSEIRYMEISGCTNKIPAATNVSNAMIVFVTQCVNQRANFFGYDKYLLTGFDYCWNDKGKYYAFNEDGDGKHNYMRHLYLTDNEGNNCYSSNNLAFSVQWITKYLNVFKLPVVQCSRGSILEYGGLKNLEEQINYLYKPEDCAIIKKYKEKLKQFQEEVTKLNDAIADIALDHHRNFRASI